jgi:hypothetical protein
MHIRDWKTQDLYGVDLDRMQDPVTLQDWYPCSPAGCDKISVATGCGLEICQNCQGVCAPTCILHKPYLGHTIPVCLYCSQAHSRRKHLSWQHLSGKVAFRPHAKIYHYFEAAPRTCFARRPTSSGVDEGEGFAISTTSTGRPLCNRISCRAKRLAKRSCLAPCMHVKHPNHVRLLYTPV